MHLSEESIIISGDIDTAWTQLVDWKTMPDWDIFMETLAFPGPIALGSVGRLKMKDGPAVNLKVTEFTPPLSYTDEFTLLGTRFIFRHFLAEQTGNRVRLSIAVDAEGLFGSMMAPLMKSQMKKKMPIILSNFKNVYESRRQNP